MSEHRLSEIVIERPRGGLRSSLRKQKGAKKQLDRLTEEAAQEGLLSPYLIKPRTKTKYLSDHLGPLRRFLRSKRGQPWNQVYSELCQRLDHSTMAGQHVLDHVWDYVEQHVELINGIPYCQRRHYRLSQARFKLYVHPDTGLLCDAHTALPLVPVVPPPAPLPDRLDLDAYHQYRQLDGIWYLITFQELPTTEPAFDVLSRATVMAVTAQVTAQACHSKHLCKHLYAAQKRQCNKRELKQIRAKLVQLRS